jgi:dolichol-phosphate mannosyltransferase
MDKIIIMPTYNEKENISDMIDMIFKILPDISMLIVDDSSPDGTADLVRQKQAQYPNLNLYVRNKKEGLGKAYIDAMSRVMQDPGIKRIITMDADFSHDPNYLPQMLTASEEYGLVVGSRYINNGGTAGWETWRKVLSFCGNFYSRTITRLKIFDYTAGFCIFNTDYLKIIDLSKIHASGYAFQMEIKYEMVKAGANFIEVPIIFKNRRGGETKISNDIVLEGIKTPWRMIFKK